MEHQKAVSSSSQQQPQPPNGAAPAPATAVAMHELPQVSGFASVAVAEGEGSKKVWKPMWATNVNTPPQPYVLSFYDSPAAHAQGSAPNVT